MVTVGTGQPSFKSVVYHLPPSAALRHFSSPALEVSLRYCRGKSTAWTVLINGSGEVFFFFYLAILFAALLPYVCHHNIIRGVCVCVGVNTVNHMSGGCVTWCSEKSADGFSFPMPRHSWPLYRQCDPPPPA